MERSDGPCLLNDRKPRSSGIPPTAGLRFAGGRWPTSSTTVEYTAWPVSLPLSDGPDSGVPTCPDVGRVQRPHDLRAGGRTSDTLPPDSVLRGSIRCSGTVLRTHREDIARW